MVTAGVVATAGGEIVEKAKGVWKEREITSGALLTDIFHKLIQLT